MFAKEQTSDEVKCECQHAPPNSIHYVTVCFTFNGLKELSPNILS